MRSEELLNPRDAARALGISYPTLKQWIYKKKLRSMQTAGGHHRIPASEIERFLPRTEEKDVLAGRRSFRRISGRNQLVGRIVEVRYSGLLAQVKLSIGGQRISSIITADAAREMRLEKGPDRGRADQIHGSHDRARVSSDDCIMRRKCHKFRMESSSPALLCAFPPLVAAQRAAQASAKAVRHGHGRGRVGLDLCDE